MQNKYQIAMTEDDRKEGAAKFHQNIADLVRWIKDRETYKKMNIDKTPLSKEELVARLKSMAADETPRVRHLGAMCYCIVDPPKKRFKCDMCGKSVIYQSWQHDKVVTSVNEMKELGYDVKLDTVCKSCAEKLKEELYPNLKKPGEEGYDEFNDIYIFEINHIFYFRTSEDENYHRAIAYHNYDYEELLCLMRNQREYFDRQMRNHYLDEEKENLEFMTGIKFDI